MKFSTSTNATRANIHACMLSVGASFRGEAFRSICRKASRLTALLQQPGNMELASTTRIVMRPTALFAGALVRGDAVRAECRLASRLTALLQKRGTPVALNTTHS